ncbi:MAG: hypothetical protein Q9191_007389 [Dirinaria sp. TL-2023a]
MFPSNNKFSILNVEGVDQDEVEEENPSTLTPHKTPMAGASDPSSTTTAEHDSSTSSNNKGNNKNTEDDSKEQRNEKRPSNEQKMAPSIIDGFAIRDAGYPALGNEPLGSQRQGKPSYQEIMKKKSWRRSDGDNGDNSCV